MIKAEYIQALSTKVKPPFNQHTHLKIIERQEMSFLGMDTSGRGLGIRKG
jgi:hypothetical protein